GIPVCRTSLGSYVLQRALRDAVVDGPPRHSEELRGMVERDAPADTWFTAGFNRRMNRGHTPTTPNVIYKGTASTTAVAAPAAAVGRQQPVERDGIEANGRD